jgi:hypothetical protein
MKKKGSQFIVLFVIGLSLLQSVYGQTSYIYIELIKTIPCKIILNGVEAIQMNKNYVILNIQEAKEQNIDIEFGANLYPKQSFIIDGVPNAMFAYKLARSSESSFYLLDLINNGKIIESNSAVNIGLASELNLIKFSTTKYAIQPNVIDKKEQNNWIKNVFTGSKKESPKVNTSQKSNTNAKKQLPYGVVEVIHPNETKPDNTKKAPIVSSKPAPEQTRTFKQIKANCYMIASENEVGSFIEKIALKSDEEVKLVMLRKKQFSGCLNVSQLTQIASQFNTQYGRYQCMKIGLSNVANPQDLPQGASIFKTEAYKNKYFKLISTIQ